MSMHRTYCKNTENNATNMSTKVYWKRLVKRLRLNAALYLVKLLVAVSNETSTQSESSLLSKTHKS